MKFLVLFLITTQGLAREQAKKKTVKQMADDAFKYDKADDITFSNEALKTDDLLMKIFPGMFKILNSILILTF